MSSAANAARWGLIDQPSERKVHTTPTPRGGGLAIWLGVVGTFAVGTARAVLLASRMPAIEALVPEFAQPHLAGIWSQSAKLWILLAAGTVLTLLGLIDDRGGLSWQLRLLVEFARRGGLRLARAEPAADGVHRCAAASPARSRCCGSSR